jgi:hypothetical protein
LILFTALHPSTRRPPPRIVSDESDDSEAEGEAEQGMGGDESPPGEGDNLMDFDETDRVSAVILLQATTLLT